MNTCRGGRGEGRGGRRGRGGGGRGSATTNTRFSTFTTLRSFVYPLVLVFSPYIASRREGERERERERAYGRMKTGRRKDQRSGVGRGGHEPLRDKNKKRKGSY